VGLGVGLQQLPPPLLPLPLLLHSNQILQQ